MKKNEVIEFEEVIEWGRQIRSEFDEVTVWFVLDDNLVANQNLKKSLNDLRELQNGEGRGRLDGGLLDAALDKLESEFRRLLTEHSVPLPMSTPPTLGEQPFIAPSPLSVAVIHKLQAILGRMIANKRHEQFLGG